MNPEEIIEDPKIEEDSDIEEDIEENIETSEQEDWMKPSTQEDDNRVPVAKFVGVKNKLKQRISDKDEEINRLIQENMKLKSNTPEKEEDWTAPNLADFDTDEEYNKSMAEYINKVTQKSIQKQTEQIQRQQLELIAKQNRDKAVNQHYEKAEEFIQKHGISGELYSNADNLVRRTIDGIRPGQGDFITDRIIEALGEGSERVIYRLGINTVDRNKLKNLLSSDVTGMSAMVFLGNLKSKTQSSSQSVVSKAPPVAKTATGDTKIVSNSNLYKKYLNAHEKNKNQEAYNFKRQAKLNGEDVSNW